MRTCLTIVVLLLCVTSLTRHACGADSNALNAEAAMKLEGKTPLHEADEVLTFVDLDVGESFRFRLKNGKTRLVQLKSQRLVTRSTYDYGVGVEVLVDGHPMKLTSWFASTKAFRPPTVVNGLRIGVEIACSGDAHFSDRRNPTEKIAYWYKLQKDVRVLVNDVTLPLWPDVGPMWDDADLQLTADQIAYRTHTFFGRRDHDTGSRGRAMGRVHNDLDIAFAVGTPHYAPFDGITTQVSPVAAMFVSRRLGRTGKRYWMMIAHVSAVLKEAGESFRRREEIAISGDELAGSIPHTHLTLVELARAATAYGEPFNGPYMNGPHINPWWLIWQGFENERARRKMTRAVMGPLSPVKAGREIAFSGEGSAAAKGGGDLSYHWDFGDEAVSSEKNPRHRYDGPGIYQVRLTVSDQKGSHAVSQYLTVDGPDNSPPQVREVIYPVQSGEERGELVVVFSEPVQKGNRRGGAENPENYQIDDGPAIGSAKMVPSQCSVHLSVKTSLREMKNYQLSVSNVRDLAGNAIKAEAPASFRVTKRMTLEPVADTEAYDHRDHAVENFGSLPRISVRAGRGRFPPWPNYGNNKFGYVRFKVPVRNVTATSLRLFVSGRSPNALYVVPLANDKWSETKLTFRNAPDLYKPEPLGVVEGRPNGWHELDVTDYVRKHLASKQGDSISFGLRAVANDTPVVQVDTREGRNSPRLVIQYEE